MIPNGLRILLVDDDPDLCCEIAEFLNHRGFSADSAEGGPQAEALCRSRPYQLLLVDYKMAGPNGEQVTKAIKQIRPEIRVIMITGRPWARELLSDDSRPLIDCVLAKPFNTDQLLAEIRKLFSPSKPEAS